MYNNVCRKILGFFYNSTKENDLYFLPFEINSVTMKNTTIFTVIGFCKMNSFRVFRFPVVVSFFLVVWKGNAHKNSSSFVDFPENLPAKKAVHNTAGFKAIPTHLSVPLRHSRGGLLWFKSLI